LATAFVNYRGVVNEDHRRRLVDCRKAKMAAVPVLSGLQRAGGDLQNPALRRVFSCLCAGGGWSAVVAAKGTLRMQAFVLQRMEAKPGLSRRGKSDHRIGIARAGLCVFPATAPSSRR
jgi:hypothetical protein